MKTTVAQSITPEITTDYSILIVDDDTGLRELLSSYLKQQGFNNVAAVESAEAMDAYIKDHSVQLFILDLMLPGEDGFSIAERLRKSINPAIIMLSARGGDEDKITGLEQGADDYLAKPFNPRELIARIKVQMRKRVNTAETTALDQYSIGDLIYYPDRLAILRGEETISLTSGEACLLTIMCKHPNKILSRDFLLDQLRGFERDPFDRSVDVRVTRLRKKMEMDPANPVYIVTVWGQGYRLITQLKPAL